MSETVALAVCATARCNEARRAAAEAASMRWSAPMAASVREALSVASAALVFEAGGVRLCDQVGCVRYSHGMAALRARRVMVRPTADPLVAIGEIRRGDRVLDGTLGFGGDALVAAAAAGPTGTVVGVEASLALAAFAAEGSATIGTPWLSAELAVTHGELGAFLQRCPEVFDMVVLDPMFSTPRKAHPSFELLRRLACHRPLGAELLDQARGHARRAVVLKVRHPNDLSDLRGVELVRVTRSSAWGLAAGAAAP